MSETQVATKDQSELSRRSFVKWSAVLGGSAALAGGFVGCAPSKEAPKDESGLPVEEGEWKPALCRNMSGCASSCANFALVKDGIITRMKTDDRFEDSRDNPQRRGCHRGLAHKQRVYGEERLKYPMKRKNWNPGGTEHNGHLRGKDEWERISWDEAIELTASELKRIIAAYGNTAVYAQNQVLSHIGGATDLFGTTSTGDSILAIKLFQGDLPNNPGLDRFLTPKNTKLIVLWGQNTAFTSATTRFYQTQMLKQDSGSKVYSVAPDYNNSAVALGAIWVPVRPGTDSALLLAMAYHMIENNLQDQDFLDRCCVGFDADHMPEGAPKEDNFKDYVLGTYDGVPKTAEWASEICGTDPALIREFATDVATIKPGIFNINGRSPWRTSNGRCSGHAAYVVGWMTGNVGIEGGSVGGGTTTATGSGFIGGDAGGWLYAGQSPDPRILNPVFPKTAVWGGYGYDDPFDEQLTAVAYSDTWNAILRKEHTAGIRGKVPIDIRCVLNICNISLGNNFINTTMGTIEAIEAYRSLEFVVCHDISLSAKSKYADIVFPDTFAWEEEGYVLPMGDPNVIYWQEQIIEPPFECQTVRYLERELAQALGVNPDDVHPFSDKQLFFEQVKGAIYLSPEAQAMVPLVTITQEDIDSYGVEGEPQEGIIGFRETLDQGGYILNREPGDFYEMVSQAGTNAAFRADPEGNPLSTQSGKLEIYCSELKRYFEAFNFETDVKCIPVYRKTKHSYEDSFTDWENKVKGPYPIQIVTPHSIRGTHTCLNDLPWLRRAHPREFIMNAIDAEARGLKTGDTVLISSQYGKILRNVAVTQSVMPGVAQVWHGSWDDFDEDGIDHGGCSNTLIGVNTMGYGAQPYNSTLVEVEKWTGTPLPADYTWPARVPLKDEE
jgi:anaerobic dimethyl sulfoxide reductase subunit A